jgi:hypothetical protein
MMRMRMRMMMMMMMMMMTMMMMTMSTGDAGAAAQRDHVHGGPRALHQAAGAAARLQPDHAHRGPEQVSENPQTRAPPRVCSTDTLRTAAQLTRSAPPQLRRADAAQPRPQPHRAPRGRLDAVAGPAHRTAAAGQPPHVREEPATRLRERARTHARTHARIRCGGAKRFHHLGASVPAPLL